MINQNFRTIDSLESAFGKKFNSFLEGIDPLRFGSRHFNTLYLLRRLFYALLFAWP